MTRGLGGSVTALPSKRLSLSISCQLSWRTVLSPLHLRDETLKKTSQVVVDIIQELLNEFNQKKDVVEIR